HPPFQASRTTHGLPQKTVTSGKFPQVGLPGRSIQEVRSEHPATVVSHRGTHRQSRIASSKTGLAEFTGSNRDMVKLGKVARRFALVCGLGLLTVSNSGCTLIGGFAQLAIEFAQFW